MRHEHLLLSSDGGDRATGYTMSAKVVGLGGRLLCTWLDSGRQNRCALIDLASGEVVSAGPLGAPGVDNHCGAALAVAESGEVHAVTGGHHTPLEHYVLDGLKNGLTWRHAGSIGNAGTYPSLLCDGRGVLHLTFRQAGDRWMLCYSRHARGAWSEPRALVVAEKAGYIYWTNELALGPEGRIHLAFSNTRPLADGSFYYGASHLFSDDSGDSWRQLGCGSLSPGGLSVSDLSLIEGQMAPERIEPSEHRAAHSAPGPRNAEYLQMNLSNPVVDDDGLPAVVVHNGMEGTASLYRHDGQDWRAQPLLGEIRQVLPGWTIHMQSALSRHADGTLEAVLMAQPGGDGWGSSGTSLVRVCVDPDGNTQTELVRPPDPALAQWLPALQRYSWREPSDRPALVFTRGRNAGGFQNNRNDLRTEVWLDLPSA